MPVVNPLARELVFKVVYYGPGLGGKTTTLQHIHAATQPEYRGKMVSLATPVDRTLYFDFLPIRVPSVRGMGVRLQLFTVPGQVYYNATRKLVLTGADGVVLVADSQRGRQDANLESLENLEENLREHGRSLQDLPFVLQYNKRDLRDVRPLEDLDRELNPHGIPSFGTVATTGAGVFEALDQITRLVLADFERRMPPSSESQAASLQVPEGGLAEALRGANYSSEQPTALSRAYPTLGDDEPDAIDAATADEELPRLSGAPESMVGEDLARSVAEFGAPQPDSNSMRIQSGRGALAASLDDLTVDQDGLAAVPALERDSTQGVEGADTASLGAGPALQDAARALGFSFSALFPRSQQRTVRELEEALAAGRSSRAVERAEHLVTRTFAAAANLISQKEAPRDPTLVALMLGLTGQRYLEFRAIARDARSGGVVATEDALIVYAFAVEARLAWRRVGG